MLESIQLVQFTQIKWETVMCLNTTTRQGYNEKNTGRYTGFIDTYACSHKGEPKKRHFILAILLSQKAEREPSVWWTGKRTRPCLMCVWVQTLTIGNYPSLIQQQTVFQTHSLKVLQIELYRPLRECSYAVAYLLATHTRTHTKHTKNSLISPISFNTICL